MVFTAEGILSAEVRVLLSEAEAVFPAEAALSEAEEAPEDFKECL